MSIYVYCPRPSNGALELVRALNASRLRRFDGEHFWDKRKRHALKEGDVIICWGAIVPELDGVRVLNSADGPMNKKEELEIFKKKGIPTITVYQRIEKAPAGEILLPRKIRHEGGWDLLVTPDVPDFLVLKENFVNEYRIHSFAGKSIRAGIKVPREGFTVIQNDKDWKADSNLVHPWVRSFDGGWRINYEGFKSNARLRKTAHAAVAALNLTFGAVDLGETKDGTIKVLEVNRAPGIEGNSVATYVRAINRWIEGKKDDDNRGAGVGEPNNV